MIALLSLAVGLAASPAVAAPLAMHADWAVSGLNTNTNAGYGFGAGIGLPVLPHVDAGIEFAHERHAYSANGATIPEISRLGGGNDYLTSAFLTVRASFGRGPRVFMEAGAGGAHLRHSTEYWFDMLRPSGLQIVPSRSTDMPATMFGWGFQTGPVVGPLRLEMGVRFQWMSGPDGPLRQTRGRLGVAL
jgi:hypothetical protein